MHGISIRRFASVIGAALLTLALMPAGVLAVPPVPPTITSANSTTFTVGAAGSFTVTTTGTPTPAITEAGSLPTGVTFVDNADGTATLAGTPAAATNGTYPFTITADNGATSNATQDFTLTVDGPPAITSGNSATFTVGVPGTFTVTATGTPTPTISKTGGPASVTLVDNGNGTATLSGTPVLGDVAGSPYTIAIKASNGIGSDATQSFTLTVQAAVAPHFTSANNAAFTVGVAGTFTVTTVSGVPTPTITESGALPSGVTLHDNGNGTATLVGTPAAATNGTYPITITASNVAGSPTQAFTLTVNTGNYHLYFSAQPGGGAAGVAWAQQPVVEVLNSLNQVVTTDNSTHISLSISTNPASGTLTCLGSSTYVQVVNGVATFSGCYINNASTNYYTLGAASAPAWTAATSNAFYIGGSETLAFATQPGGGGTGAVWSQQPVVEVLNSLGQVVTSDSSTVVYLTIGTNPAGGTLTCTNGNSATVVNGYAYFYGCSINVGSSNYYTLYATSSPAWTSATSSAFYIGGTNETLYFATQPGGGAAGAAWSQQPVVEVLNSSSQVVSTDNSTVVYLSIGTNPAGGTLTCTNGTSATVVSGYAHFYGCSISVGSSAYYTLYATSSPAWTSATSGAFYVSTGGQSALAISSTSALGLKPTSGFTSKTPKVTTVGQYVTWQFTGGAALAGQRVNVLVATKVNGVWGQAKYLKSAWADANGIVTFARRLTSAGAINVRVQLYGNPTYATSYSKPLGAYWR